MDHEHAERHIWPVAATRETAKVEGASRTIRPQPWIEAIIPLSGENRPPRYPPEAVRKGIEGRILLQLEVLADGTVGEVTVVESSGSDLLDEEAIRKVRTWRFAPARCGGRPVVSRVLVPIRFELR